MLREFRRIWRSSAWVRRRAFKDRQVFAGIYDVSERSISGRRPRVTIGLALAFIALRPLGLITAFLLPFAALSGPPEAAELLARFRQTAATEYRYEETRTLELLAAPWKGKGYLLSSPNGALVKLQLSPERIVMAVSGDRLYYYDYTQGQRQSAPLSAAGPMARQVGAFRALLQGRAEELKNEYEIRAESQAKSWTLVLAGKPKEGGEPAPTLEISDDTALRRRRIIIRQPDGEETVYLMEKAAEGKHLEPWIQRLMAEAAGG